MPETLRTPEGKAVVVPDDEVAAKLRLGYARELPEEAASRTAATQVQADNSSLANKATTVVTGALRGATLGGSDVLARAAGGGESARALQRLREANPTLSTAGEIFGAVAPALLSGGSSALGSAARATPTGALATATARVAGSGGIVRGAAAGALEGAAQSAGAYLSDVALENKDLSAEGFLASAGQGALLGGAVGGGLAAAERGFVAARDLFAKHAVTPEAVTRAADDVDVELQRAFAAGDDNVARAKEQLEIMRLQRAELDVAAQQRVLEKRAAEAAKAQAAADLQAQKLATQKQLDDLRIAKAKEPRTHRPGSGGKTRSPVGQSADDVIGPPVDADAPSAAGAAAPAAKAGKPAKGSLVDASGAPAKTWREFVGERMGAYMKSEGGHGPAITKIGQEWQAYKATLKPAAAAEEAAGKAAVLADDAARTGDDIVGPPIGNVRPGGSELGAPADNFGSRYGNAPAGMEDDSLEDLLRKSVEQGKRTTSLDEIHEAMAEIDPEAAKLVDAVRAQEAAAANLQKRFKVRAPQEIGGSTTAVIPDAPNLTLGRVKQMYEKANEAERVALLQQVGPEKAKALLEIVEGRAGFAKWYKNKHHWWDDPSYGPLPTRPGPAADDLGDLAPHALPGFEGATPGADDLARMADDELAGLDDMRRALDEISGYERSVSDLAQALGPAAPPSAAQLAARYGAAVDDQARKSAERLAQVADDVPTPVLAQGSGPMAAPVLDDAVLSMPLPVAGPGSGLTLPAPSLAAQLADDAAQAGARAQAVDLVALPGAAGAAAGAAPKGKVASMLADLGAANEALQYVGISLPFVPDVDKLPVIGPILGAYLKLRAGAKVLSRAGFKVPFVGEAKVAAGAAATRDRMAKSVDKLLGGAAKATRAARPVLAAQAWRAPDVLSQVLYDTGAKPARGKGTSKDPGALLRARSEELLAASANPAGVQATVREQLRDVRDPDVIAAVAAVAQRKLDYLAKHVPVAPPAGLLSRSTWKPSPTEVERFARRVRAANDPASVLEDVGRGRITPEAAETLREVYPQLYAEAQARLVQQAGQLRQRLPHGTVVRLSVLFNAPLVSSLEPENLAAIQAAGAPAMADPAAAGGGAPMPAMQPPPAGAPDLAGLYMTPADKRAAR